MIQIWGAINGDLKRAYGNALLQRSLLRILLLSHSPERDHAMEAARRTARGGKRTCDMQPSMGGNVPMDGRGAWQMDCQRNETQIVLNHKNHVAG